MRYVSDLGGSLAPEKQFAETGRTWLADMAVRISVALDGPSASGKTTVAKRLARKVGYLYLDTGAMYRAVALLALRNAVELDSDDALTELIASHPIHIDADSSTSAGYRVFVDELDVTDQLTAPDVTAAVSSVAAQPHVRAALVVRQREIAERGPVVMAGRDIGTVVLPDSQYKFYLTASLDERAKRRLAELVQAGVHTDESHVRAQLAERDRIDESRAASPLRPDAAALIIDSTAIDAEEVVRRMLAHMGRA